MSACNNNPAAVNDGKTQSESEANKTPKNQSTSPQEPEKINKANSEKGTENLFDFKEYDGTKEITLEWGGQQSSAQFMKAPILPLGLYIPDKMEIYEFEDGNRWGYDQDKNSISILEFSDTYLTDLNIQKKELQKFKEYVGSHQEGVLITDAFVVEKEKHQYYVELRYFEDEQDQALPMFLEVVRHIRHVAAQ